MGEYVLGLAQCMQPEDGDVLRMVHGYFEQAKAEDVDLLAFPECLMAEYDKESGAFTRPPEPLDGPFASAINAMAAEFGMWCIYTMNEAAGAPDVADGAHEAAGMADVADGAHEAAGTAGAQAKAYNTAVLVDNEGAVRGSYRKVHLFKSDFTDESDRISPGSGYFDPVQAPFARIGMAICYDLRFPDQAADAATKGCDLFVYPSAWFAGKTKEAQWRTLLGARAIEDKMVVAGLSRCDSQYIGQSCVMGPLGETLASAGPEPCLLTCRLESRQA